MGTRLNFITLLYSCFKTKIRLISAKTLKMILLVLVPFKRNSITFTVSRSNLTIINCNLFASLFIENLHTFYFNLLQRIFISLMNCYQLKIFTLQKRLQFFSNYLSEKEVFIDILNLIRHNWMDNTIAAILLILVQNFKDMCRN